MPYQNSQQTIFIDYEADLNTSWPDGIQVFCKDTNNTWTLDNGVFVAVGGNSVKIQNGINTFTGGTTSLPTVNITAATLSTLTVSGATSLNTMSATTVSASTLYSGSTNLYNIFLQTGYSGGTQPMSGVSSISSLQTNNIFYFGLPQSVSNGDGSVALFNAYADLGSFAWGNASQYRAYAGPLTGETNNVYGAVAIGASKDNLKQGVNATANAISYQYWIKSGSTAASIFGGRDNVIGYNSLNSSILGGSGNTINNNITGSTILGGSGITAVNSYTTYTPNLVVTGTSMGNLYATNYFSGSTPLQLIISSIITATTVAGGTNINGLNTYTAGTSTAQSINISAATLDNLTVSGNTILAQTTGTTLNLLNSGATTIVWNDASSNRINTGVTFSSIIGGTGNTINANLSNVQILGGYGLTGTNTNYAYATNLVVTGSTLLGPTEGKLYARTIYSGNTELSLLMGGGSGEVNTASNVGSGNALFKQKTGVDLEFRTISAGTNITIVTGDTWTISSTDTNDITRVGGVGNIFTGGTDNFPTINLVASPSINGLNASGASVFTGGITANTLSATTFSAGTIYSGSTNLYSIFAPIGGGGGEVNTASNVGSGNAIFKQKTGVNLEFRTISAGTNVTIVTGDTWTINASVAGGSVSSVGSVGNILTGGTSSNPTISITGSPSFNEVLFSGTAIGNQFSANTISGNTIFLNPIQYSGVTTTPTSAITLFASTRAGKILPTIIDQEGFNYNLQPSLMSKSVGMVFVSNAGASAALTTFKSTAPTVLGSNKASAIALTRLFTSIKRYGVQTTSAASNLSCGIRSSETSPYLWRGNAAGLGGFLWQATVGVSDAATVANSNCFYGLWSGTGSIGTVNNITGMTSIIGIGSCTGNTNLSIIYNDGAGNCTTISLGANFPAQTLSTDLYDIRIFAPSNGSYMGISIERLNTGNYYEAILDTNIPTNNGFLSWHLWRSNATTALQAGLDITQVYWETKY